MYHILATEAKLRIILEVVWLKLALGGGGAAHA